jgi:hypothetical protein
MHGKSPKIKSVHAGAKFGESSLEIRISFTKREKASYGFYFFG